jgi:hypothetical protein
VADFGGGSFIGSTNSTSVSDIFSKIQQTACEDFLTILHYASRRKYISCNYRIQSILEVANHWYPHRKGFLMNRTNVWDNRQPSFTNQSSHTYKHSVQLKVNATILLQLLPHNKRWDGSANQSKCQDSSKVAEEVFLKKKKHEWEQNWKFKSSGICHVEWQTVSDVLNNHCTSTSRIRELILLGLLDSEKGGTLLLYLPVNMV